MGLQKMRACPVRVRNENFTNRNFLAILIAGAADLEHLQKHKFFSGKQPDIPYQEPMQ